MSVLKGKKLGLNAAKLRSLETDLPVSHTQQGITSATSTYSRVPSINQTKYPVGTSAAKGNNFLCEQLGLARNTDRGEHGPTTDSDSNI